MGKVSGEQFGKSRAKITPEDLEGDVAILTIASYEQMELDDAEAEGGKRTSAVLTFQETGDKVIWLNKTQVDALIARLGDESDDWAGQKVPVEKVVATFGKNKYPKVVVVGDPDEWDAYLNNGGRKKKAKAVAKVGKKKGK